MVKTAILSKIGPAEEVVNIESISQSDFDDSSILVKMQFAPINPADILMIEGNYASVPNCPTEIGIEGSGIIEEVGNKITNFKVGDKVMCLSRTNWKTTQILKENEVIKLPESIDLQQAAMLKVNLASAYLMLTNFRKLSKGNWIIQNASNSAVGKNIIYLSKSLGLKTINLVRRDNVIDELLDIGADIVINSDDINVIKKELHSKVDGPISLGIDAVAGDATNLLASLVNESGLVINYGLLSGKACSIDPLNIVFRSIVIEGFWLAKEMRSMDYMAISTMYNNLIPFITNKQIYVNVDKTFPLSKISEALKAAKAYGRNGKIQLDLQG